MVIEETKQDLNGKAEIGRCHKRDWKENLAEGNTPSGWVIQGPHGTGGT